MKFILIMFLLSPFLFADEHRLLITGFSKHEKSHDNDGDKFNEFNYGLGYEYNNFKDYNEAYFAGNFSVLKDSYDEWQYTLSASPNIRFELNQDFSFSIGLAGFVMYKKDNFKKNVSKEDAKYDLLVGAAPLSSLYYKDFSVNIAYVPSVSFMDFDTVGFVLVYFGYTF